MIILYSVCVPKSVTVYCGFCECVARFFLKSCRLSVFIMWCRCFTTWLKVVNWKKYSVHPIIMI